MSMLFLLFFIFFSPIKAMEDFDETQKADEWMIKVLSTSNEELFNNQISVASEAMQSESPVKLKSREVPKKAHNKARGKKPANNKQPRRRNPIYSSLTEEERNLIQQKINEELAKTEQQADEDLDALLYTRSISAKRQKAQCQACKGFFCEGSGLTNHLKTCKK